MSNQSQAPRRKKRPPQPAKREKNENNQRIHREIPESKSFKRKASKPALQVARNDQKSHLKKNRQDRRLRKRNEKSG